MTSKVADFYAQLYAWRDATGAKTHRSSYRLLHHFLLPDGQPGAASVRACAEGLIVLERFWYLLRPAKEIQDVYTHLAAHLKDAGREPPNLRATGDVRYPLDDQIELALWHMENILHDIDHAREGLPLSDACLHQMDRLHETLDTLCTRAGIEVRDRPLCVTLEELTAETRAQMLDRRVEELHRKREGEVHHRERAEIMQRVKHWREHERQLEQWRKARSPIGSTSDAHGS